MNYYDHIDDYVAGILSDELKQAFEAAMVDDASLRSAVDNYDDAKSISEGLLEIDMMDTISRLKAEKSNSQKVDKIKSANPQTKIFTIRRLMAAASLIGLVALATWWINDDSAMKEKMWADRYAMIIDPDATKSGGDLDGKDPLQIVKHYYARNYNEECIEAVESLLESTTNPDTVSKAYLYLGDTYLKQSYHFGKDQWKESIAAFEKSNEPESTVKKQLTIDLSK